MVQNVTRIVKNKFSFDGSKWRRIALSYNKKTNSITKRNNV